jgi:hypothetical protein
MCLLYAIPYIPSTTVSTLKEKVNVRAILESLMDRLAGRCHRIIGVVSVVSMYNCVYYCDT